MPHTIRLIWQSSAKYRLPLRNELKPAWRRLRRLTLMLYERYF
jgi:hypothetical protein